MSVNEWDTAGCHHYTECGLENVYLRNGFRKVEHNGSIVVVVEDPIGLHQAIGKRICGQRFISGDEFRFLRNEMRMSQSRLGAVLGVSENMVSLWERRSAIPKQAVAMLKAMYSEHIKVSYKITALLDVVSKESAANELMFGEYQQEWSVAMAA